VLAGKTFAAIGGVAARQLSHREQVRVGAAASFAIQAIQSRFAEGQTPRDDGFFDDKKNERSAADQILEGVL
jgi:hypothetical protein